MKTNNMKQKIDKREAPRVDTCNLISQISMDEDGCMTSRSMGIAFNISTSGILLETSHKLQPGYVSLMTSDMDDNLIEIKGEVVYSHKTRIDKYESGISFLGSEYKKREFSKKLIKVFHYRKNGHISEII